jgi:8-oxo-dGTP pyrophosphatase MutT (NUDIX family)
MANSAGAGRAGDVMAHDLQADGRVHGVVIGCRRADGRFLMVRRSRHVPLPRKVCFPGGGICLGESQESACIREVMEELGVTITPLKAVWLHDLEGTNIKLHGWLATLHEGEIHPQPLEIEEVLWLTREEALAHPDGLPTNQAFIDALEMGLKSLRNPGIEQD